MTTKIAIEIDCDGRMCGNCRSVFKRRVPGGIGSPWMCNMFNLPLGKQQLNTKGGRPRRCAQCQENEVKDGD